MFMCGDSDMKKIVFELFRPFAMSFGIVLLVAVCMYHSSCQITPEGITLISDGASCVRIVDYNVENPFIKVSFSKEVNISKVFAVEADETKTSIENFINSEEKILVDYSSETDKKNIIFEVKEKTKIGKNYELFASVKDEYGNSLSFTIPFYGENKNIPKVIISEAGDNYNKAKQTVEYIELFCLTSGNLFGLELYTASDGKTYKLPCCEVKKGEYIVVHLRRSDTNGLCVSELENDLNLSKAPDSVSDARDIWFTSDDSALSSTAEIILLKNKTQSIIEDCVMYCTRDYSEQNEVWKNDELQNIALVCKEKGLWGKNCMPSDAVYSTEAKSTSYVMRTNCEQLLTENQKNTRDNWLRITKTQLTPGRSN